MSDFISNINIESFRGIKEWELNDLLPINILTGDNNTGKTSVLEILQSIKAPGDFRLWRSLIRKETKRELCRFEECLFMRGSMICLILIRVKKI